MAITVESIASNNIVHTIRRYTSRGALSSTWPRGCAQAPSGVMFEDTAPRATVTVILPKLHSRLLGIASTALPVLSELLSSASLWVILKMK